MVMLVLILYLPVRFVQISERRENASGVVVVTSFQERKGAS